MSFFEAQMERDREDAPDRGYDYETGHPHTVDQTDTECGCIKGVQTCAYHSDRRNEMNDPRSEPTRPGESYWDWYLRADKRNDR